MDQIKDVWEKTLCESIAGQLGRTRDRAAAMSQSITLGPAQIQIARDGIKKLWRRQVDHVAGVDKLFAMMFFIKDRKINIHPNILKGGLPGLDSLAAISRKLLAGYYVDCESSYKDTVGKIVGIPVVAAAAAPVAPVVQAQARAQGVIRGQQQLQLRQGQQAAAQQRRG
jgi:hypothetical protein